MMRAILTAATLGAAAAFVPAAWHHASPRAALVRLQMGSTSDFKNGLTIEYDGAPCKITEFLHVKPGKGSAFVRTKFKNMISGNAGENTFRAGEPITIADVERTDFQFSYVDGENYVFMNMETYEEQFVPEVAVGDAKGFLFDGVQATITMWASPTGSRVIDVELPNTLDIKVVETDPNVATGRKQGGTKPAVLETGATVMVPEFIETGEIIKVDTRDGRYMSRAEKKDFEK